MRGKELRHNKSMTISLKLASLAAGVSQRELYDLILSTDVDCDSEGCWPCGPDPDTLNYKELTEEFPPKSKIKAKVFGAIAKLLRV